ncbi:hypothetical protein AwEntero_09160 [Enterobacterales bacterium]|nr:hypothetical protein AwEntero_09160 [Enterobacterales bacterium]
MTRSSAHSLSESITCYSENHHIEYATKILLPVKYPEPLPAKQCYLQINLSFENVIRLGHDISTSNWKKTGYTGNPLGVRVKTDEINGFLGIARQGEVTASE